MQIALTWVTQVVQCTGCCNDRGLIILSKEILNRVVTFYKEVFHFARGAVILNLVISRSKDARYQIPYNSVEPNGQAFKLTTLIDAITLLD